jgi:hypothetical protein
LLSLRGYELQANATSQSSSAFVSGIASDLECALTSSHLTVHDSNAEACVVVFVVT